jgi:hypothetical protein
MFTRGYLFLPFSLNWHPQFERLLAFTSILVARQRCDVQGLCRFAKNIEQPSFVSQEIKSMGIPRS